MAGTLIHRVDPYNRTAPMLDRQTGWIVRRLTQQISGIGAGRNQKKMATYQSVGVPSTYLQNGPQSINFIVNGDLGQISRAWISFTITVSNAPVTLLPAFMWIDRIHSYRNSTNSKGMESNWVSNFMAYGNLTPSQFDNMARSMLCDPEDAWTVEPLQPATYNVYVPLYYTTLFTGANLHYYPERMNITIDSPNGGCIESGTPGNVVLNSAALILEETQVPIALAQKIEESHMNVVQRVFLDWLALVPQSVTIASGVGTQITITMTGLEGVSPFLVFGFRAQSDNTAANGGLKRFVKIGTNNSTASVALLTPAGTQIFNQPIDTYLQQIMTSEFSYGGILDRQWSGLYVLDYTKDRIASFNGVIGAGWRKAENNEQLQFTFGRNVAEVARTVALTTIDPSGSIIAAVGGKYQLQYTNGYGAVFVSDFIDYNASQTVVQAALYGMQIVGGAKLTAGATNVNTVTGLTVTMTSLNDFDTATQGARWAVMTSSLRSATSVLMPSIWQTVVEPALLAWHQVIILCMYGFL